MAHPQEASSFTPVQIALAAIVAVPLTILAASLALTGLINAFLLRAPVWFGAVTALYLAGLLLAPRAVYRRSVRRGDDKRIAVKRTVYSLLALSFPIILLIPAGAM